MNDSVSIIAQFDRSYNGLMHILHLHSPAHESVKNEKQITPIFLSNH